ncbi:MAG TPA: PP2C family protein-serine/threonine phosphatase [Candidatus Angelobacter sp.]|nr:PP2C family protein-serine/threonine phosphatase [Candidatus Angelobacter sp.]
MPNRSLALFVGYAFFLMVPMIVVQTLPARRPSYLYWLPSLVTGFWVVIAFCINARGKPWQHVPSIAAFVLVMVGVISFVRRHTATNAILPEDIRIWLDQTAHLVSLFMFVAWTFAIYFVRREGQRLFRAQTEIKLAGEIHRALAPTIEHREGDHEFYGACHPSGLVGGDLVDVVARDGRWLAYVVDVAGHGVNSGVLMAMIKSSIHTALRFNPTADGLLEEVNRVLCSLKATNMFATCGLIAFSPENGLRYALAGHLPILRLRDGRIETLGEQSLPLGMFPDAKFTVTSCEARKGDVLVLVTDGLTEATYENGEEIGISGISEALQAAGNQPAIEIGQQILETIRSQSESKGSKSDDQSLLIVRCHADSAVRKKLVVAAS